MAAGQPSYIVLSDSDSDSNGKNENCEVDVHYNCGKNYQLSAKTYKDLNKQVNKYKPASTVKPWIPYYLYKLTKKTVHPEDGRMVSIKTRL